MKKLMSATRHQLLKINWIHRRVIEYKKRRHREAWRLIMPGDAVRIYAPDKPEDEPMVVDYLDGRMIGQRAVTPRVMRPFGMWRW